MAGTCSASTVRSGSAMVISIPSTRATLRGIAIWRARLMYAPIPLPMGVMDMSTPRVNTPTPTISSREPNRNSTSAPVVRGTMDTLSSSTMAVMGRTEERDSLIFSNSCGLMRTGRSFLLPSGRFAFFLFYRILCWLYRGRAEFFPEKQNFCQ